MESRARERTGELGRQLSFALYGAANRMIRHHKPILEPLGLTFPQYLVILALIDGAPRTVGALGACLEMDTGTITPLVKRLETAGLVTRRRDREDERRVLVDLTAAGRALEAEVCAVTAKIDEVCPHTADELEHLRRTLDELGRPTGS